MAGRLGMRVLVALCATGLGASACRAEEWSMQTRQPQSTQIQSVEHAQGVWKASSTSGDGECQISLVNTRSGTDYDVSVERCTLSLFGAAHAWRPTEGGFELYGKDGRPIIRFRQIGVDAFVSLDDAYRLERASAN